MTKVKLVKGEVSDRPFYTTTMNTGLSQRESLEEVIVNLATSLGAAEVTKRMSSRGSIYYAVDDAAFQSATNTILDLSRKMLKTRHSA